jgi:hypothetical protein
MYDWATRGNMGIVYESGEWMSNVEMYRSFRWNPGLTHSRGAVSGANKPVFLIILIVLTVLIFSSFLMTPHGSSCFLIILLFILFYLKKQEVAHHLYLWLYIF